MITPNSNLTDYKKGAGAAAPGCPEYYDVGFYSEKKINALDNVLLLPDFLYLPTNILILTLLVVVLHILFCSNNAHIQSFSILFI